MAEYLLAAVTAAVLVVLMEVLALRTGLFRRPAYWITMAIVLGFQVPVDGWLTKLDAPIVLYAEWAISGVRVPWDIPVEDFLYGFAMVTAVLLLWERRRSADGAVDRR
ncbi:lycopene cyclase domain-containing protein [Saccharothrix saharensis]|uniref:lycopene cyclase domain-containing protein n=1 Tax=Saccharothrix saharensis TaxID=571190 RepID=UPI0036C22037